MTRRSFRVGLVLGLLAGGGVAAVVTARRRAATPPTPVREPVTPHTPRPAAPSAPSAAAAATAAAEPDAGAAAPAPGGDDAAAPTPGPAAEATSPGATWTAPLDGGACPGSHPVKAKLTSGIFHLPGMAMYGRTRADRCYVSAEAAEADGLRRSTR